MTDEKIRYNTFGEHYYNYSCFFVVKMLQGGSNVTEDIFYRRSCYYDYYIFSQLVQPIHAEFFMHQHLAI